MAPKRARVAVSSMAVSGRSLVSTVVALAARRLTEIDYLNGGIVSFGRDLGVPTPLNEAILALVHGVEESW